MDKNLNQKEAKKSRESTEIKIEDKIHNMLNEVMEEKDSNESFDYDYGEIDDEFQLSNPSTRRQTVTNPNELIDSYINSTQFLAYPQINRANKRYLTHNLNPVPNPHFNGPILHMPRRSVQYSNFGFNDCKL